MNGLFWIRNFTNLLQKKDLLLTERLPDYMTHLCLCVRVLCRNCLQQQTVTWWSHTWIWWTPWWMSSMTNRSLKSSMKEKLPLGLRYSSVVFHYCNFLNNIFNVIFPPYFQCIYLFSCVWSLGASIDARGRKDFDKVLREILEVNSLSVFLKNNWALLWHWCTPYFCIQGVLYYFWNLFDSFLIGYVKFKRGINLFPDRIIVVVKCYMYVCCRVPCHWKVRASITSWR